MANGVDPSENKKAVKVEQEQEAITFEVVARDWHASNQKWSASHSARLVQEGNRLHYLVDRASITGEFSNAESLKLDEVFPHFISQMESMLTTGEMNPRHGHCLTLYHNGFTCEADTLASHGYVYIVIYPAQR